MVSYLTKLIGYNDRDVEMDFRSQNTRVSTYFYQTASEMQVMANDNQIVLYQGQRARPY